MQRSNLGDAGEILLLGKKIGTPWACRGPVIAPGEQVRTDRLQAVATGLRVAAGAFNAIDPPGSVGTLPVSINQAAGRAMGKMLVDHATSLVL